MYTSVCNADIRTGAGNENCSGGIYMTVVVALVVVVHLAMVLVVFCLAKKKIRSPMNICSNTKIKYIHFHLSHIKSGMLMYPQKSCEL